VLADQLWRRARSLEPLGQLAVMHPPPRPGDPRVDGLADEGVTKKREAVVDLDKEPALDRLLESRCSGQVGDESEIEPASGDGGHLESVTGLPREPVGTQENRFPHGFGERHSVTGRELNQLVLLLEPPIADERGREFLDEERHALRSFEDLLGEPRAQAPPNDARGQFGRLTLLERRQHEFLEPCAAAKLGTHATERVSARGLVTSVDREEEKRPVLHRRRERRQELERRVVTPLEVVE
jgi:hypothetical protein